MKFASDNIAGVAPQVMEAMAKANNATHPSYGNDEITHRAVQMVRDVFEAPEAAVYFVATGTAANALALSTLTNPWNGIYCHRTAHIETDECGAPEFYTGGAKLVLVDGQDGLIEPDKLATKLAQAESLGVHGVQRGAVSITSATERGTIYGLDHIQEITTIAKSYGLPVHLDGARFANAMQRLGCTAAEMTWKSGIDVVSFGATKNGAMNVEAVVFFDPKHAWEFELRRKRGAHLFSKHRFLSSQMIGYLENDLWLSLASHANAACDRLVAGLHASAHATLLHPAQANMCFATMTRGTHNRLMDAGAYYGIEDPGACLEGDPNEQLICRLVCHWNTEHSEIDQFLELLG